MKKMNMNYEREVKKRIESQKWQFPSEQYEYANQIKMINDISGVSEDLLC